MQRFQRSTRFLVTMALLGFTTSALADNQNLLEAERFAARARLAGVAGAHATAGAAFEKAYDSLSNPNYLFEAGKAYTEATAWASAARVYAILMSRPLPADQLAMAQQELDSSSAKLEGIRSRLAVHISPPGAQVEVDGVALSFGNPATSWVEAGRHVVRVGYPGFATVERVVEVSLEAPSIVTVDLERIAGGIGTLRVSSPVEGASVVINGESVGTTPVGILQRPQGIYDIRIEKSGYQPWERSVSVQKNLPTEVMAKLEAIPEGGVAVMALPMASPASPASTPAPAAAAPALTPVGNTGGPEPQVREMPLVIQSNSPAAPAPVAASSEEDAPILIAAPASAEPLTIMGSSAVPQAAPPLTVVNANALPAGVEEALPIPEAPQEEIVMEEPVAYEDYAEDVSDSADFGSGGGGGDATLIGWGWGLAGLGAVVAGGGYYFTMEAGSAAETRDGVPIALPASGEYNPGGELDPSDPQAVEYWQTSLFPYYWNEADTEAKANTMLSYVLYGSGGAILITGVTLAIMGHLDGGSGEVSDAEVSQPTWIGFGTVPTKGGAVFSSGLRF